MKAIVYTKYGPPDVLQLKEVEKPASKDDEVLIEVHAASVNAYDWHLLTADIFLVRLMGGGLLKPKNTIPGIDIAGRVETVGRNVKQFRPGDEVFGDISASSNGGFAEYVSVPESALVLKPANLSFEEAAAVPMAAVTALQGLRDKGQIQPGQKVLINGASGGVGTFAVQIAKYFGAEVTAVCSTRNVDLAHSLGADHVIDYTKEDFTNRGELYDFIFNAVGKRKAKLLCKKALTPNGKHITVDDGSPKVHIEDLILLKELVEAGKIKPVIDRCYPLEQMAEAHRYVDRGHKKGNIVITVG